MSGMIEAYIAYSIMFGLVIWFSRDLLADITSLEAELEALSDAVDNPSASNDSEE